MAVTIRKFRLAQHGDENIHVLAIRSCRELPQRGISSVFPYLSICNFDGIPITEGTKSAAFGTEVECDYRGGGMFARWSWDGNTLTAQTDPFGMYSLFYAVTNDGLAISTSPVQLIANGVAAEFDNVSLAVFHMLGFFIGGDTPFRAIKVLNGNLRWTPSSGLSISEHEIGRRDVIRTLKEAIAEYDRLFATAIRRCGQALTHELVVPLSGGRDSRHILLEVVRQGLPLDHCLTFDPSMGEETDPDSFGARLVTERLQVPHRMIPALESRYRDQIITHGMAHLCTDEHVQYLAAYRYFRTQDCAIFDGIAGDSLSRNKSFTHPQMVAMIRNGQTREAVDLLVSENANITRLRESDITDLSPDFVINVNEAKERIADSLNARTGSADPYAHFVFSERTRREISLAPNAMLSSARQVFAPYLDPDLVELCLSLPYDITKDGQFHDHVIASSFPDFDVPYNEAFVGAWPRPTIGRRIGRALEAIAASRLWSASAMPREAARQGRLLLQPHRSARYIWETYYETLRAVQDREHATNYLKRLKNYGGAITPQYELR